MANPYERMDLTRFKKKLAEGGYKDLTSVRKGIGRLRDWSEADKGKAIGLADKHFSGAAPKPAAPKKPPKKAARAKAEKPTKEVAPKKAMRRVRQQPDEGPMTSGVPLMDRIHETNYQIETYGKAIDHMAKSKQLGCPSNVVQEGAKIAQEGLIAAVNNLCAMTKEASQSLHGGNDGSNQRGREAFGRAYDAAQTGQGGPPPIPQRPFPPPPPQPQTATDPPEEDGN